MSITEPSQPLVLNTTVPVFTSNIQLTDLDWIVISNNSPFVLQVQSGSNVLTIPAWYYYPVALIDGKGQRLLGFSQPFNVTPIQQTIPGSLFTAQLFTTIYGHGETPSITSPQALGGGPTDLTIASQIISTNQPPSNVIVFAEPVGDTSVIGAVNLNNQGQLVLGDNTYPGSILLESGPKQISFSFTGWLRMIDGTGNQRIDIEPGVFVLSDASLHQAIIANTDGSPVLDLSHALGAISLALKTGSLTRTSKFTGTATTTPTFFNHGLGDIPDLVIPTFNSTSSTVHGFAVDYASLTTTQAKITSDGTNPFVALAIKF